MQQGWKDLPTWVVVPLIQTLTSMEIKTMRLVCSDWKQEVDREIVSLTPRRLSQSQVGSHHYTQVSNGFQ